MTMRTVTLELLRHGPAHNQLLSPLTPYLALCGNHDASTVHVGFEHLQLTRVIEQLRYVHGQRMASCSLTDAAREVSRLLESIQSLTAELSSSDPLENRRMVHLRLVLSASELALLPFELATSHAGMPGQGQPLSLQTETPVCLTREVRRVAATTLRWPKQPRILFVMAAPRGVSMVPGREHLAALEGALAPYVELSDAQERDAHLTVLSEASLEDVRRACEKAAYTHVHILAHGIGREALGNEARFGLAFHAEENRNEVDVVSGERLASALRCHLRTEAGKVLSSPTVVSIASCDSANVGSVVAPGASVAHALHEQGIPLVVGSQFPLSVKGSVVMTELLYRRLLAGDDPRITVHDLRQALHTACPEAHDWASVVVYAALPGDLRAQLQEAKFEQARRALDIVMYRADKALVYSYARRYVFDREIPGSIEEDQVHVARLIEQLREAMSRFEATVPKGGAGAGLVKFWGLLASAWKQVGAILSSKKGLTSQSHQSRLQNSELHEALEKSRHYYHECYRHGATEAWPLVQYLALTVGLQLEPKGEKVSQRFRHLWGAAFARAQDNLQWGSMQQRAWAHASLAELHLLSMLWRKDSQRCAEKVESHVDQAISIWEMAQYEEARFDLISLGRQLFNYDLWDWGTQEIRSLAQKLYLKIHKRVP